jgi:hypothetical protein
MGCCNRAVAAAGLAGLVGIACLVAASAAWADHEPVIALPGNPEVPVIIDGMPATGAIVTGDWGLYAPGRVAPEIIGPALLQPQRGTGYYYPRTGRPPRYGRQEVVTPRHHPRPAESFHREWSVESGHGPVTEYPPFDPPPVILAPDRRFRAR